MGYNDGIISKAKHARKCRPKTEVKRYCSSKKKIVTY